MYVTNVTRSPSPIAMGGRHTLVRAGTPSQPSHRHPLSSCCNDGGWPPNPHRPTPHTGTRSHRAATMADGHQTHTDQRPALSSIFARPHPHSAKKTRRHRPANPALASSANTNAKMAPRYFFFFFRKTWFKVHASRTTAHHEGYGSAPTTRRSLR